MLTDLEETDLDVIFIEASGLADPQQVEDTSFMFRSFPVVLMNTKVQSVF